MYILKILSILYTPALNTFIKVYPIESLKKAFINLYNDILL